MSQEALFLLDERSVERSKPTPEGGYTRAGSGEALSTAAAAGPLRYRTRPDLCATHGHPGVTFNPLHDYTSCLCGERRYEGCPPSVDLHLACCHGPLTEPIEEGR